MNKPEVKRADAEIQISVEQFIPDHVFLFVTKGSVRYYDGGKSDSFKAGEFCIVRKNRLARYNKEKGTEGFEYVFICFGEPFFKSFQEKHKIISTKFNSEDTFVKIKPSKLIPDFIQSLKSYYDNSGKLDPAFAEVKYEELVIILLKNQPELGGIFFDFGAPEKVNLEAFMNRNFQFNVSLRRFAYLTGRSLSAFKRDFKTIFNETPNRWLVQKRLKEAYFLIDKKNKKPSEIYLDLGFQDLSHFSFAFKKQFASTPTELIERNNAGNR